MTTKIKLNQVYPIPASASNSELTGTPTAPTPATSDDSTKIATTEYVNNVLTYADRCGIKSNNTNNYPYHRIATTGILTGTYRNFAITLLLEGRGINSGFGIIKIECRLDSSSAVSTCSAKWIVRDKLNIDSIQIGHRNAPVDSIYDVFFKTPNTWYSMNCKILSQGSGNDSSSKNFTLLESFENSNTTSEDKLTSVEAYASIALANSELYTDKPYTTTVVPVDALDSSYLPLSGGTLTGSLTGITPTNRVFSLFNHGDGDDNFTNIDFGWNYVNRDGAGAAFRSVDSTLSGQQGAFVFYTRDATNNYTLTGKCDGTLVWTGPVPAASTDNTQLATTAYVKDCVPKSIGSSTQPVYTDSNGVVTVGTYELNKTVPSNAVFTDVNVTATKITYPSSATNYYPVASNADATGTAGLYKFGSDIRYQVKAGTTSAEGQAELILGNSTASGTAGNTTGDVCLYNNSGKYSVIKGHSGDTTNRTNYLPKASGTLVCHTTDTAIGDANTPVYITADGVATSTGKSFASYVTLTTAQTISGAKTFSGTSTFSGQVILSKNTAGSGTAANAVALIVGGAQTAAHLELDPNGIMAKSNGTTVTTLYLQDGNACVYLTTSTTAPNVTNTLTLGASGKVWKQLYAGTTTISTSDARMKQDIEDIPEEVLDAWEEVEFKQFKFNDSVEEKGSENARIHMGLIAQEIKAAFEKHGLDPFKYGLLCWDEWDEHENPKDENSPVIAHKDQYALRYEEALCLEAACERRFRKRVMALLNKQ